MKLYKKINTTLIHIVKVTILSDHRTFKERDCEDRCEERW